MKCFKCDGTSLTLFTLIGRYTSLVFSAAIDVMESQGNKIILDREMISVLEKKFGEVTLSNRQTQSQLDDANVTIVKLNKNFYK